MAKVYFHPSHQLSVFGSGTSASPLSSGRRPMTTFRKLPMLSPTSAIQVAMTASKEHTGYLNPAARRTKEEGL